MSLEDDALVFLLCALPPILLLAFDAARGPAMALLHQECQAKSGQKIVNMGSRFEAFSSLSLSDLYISIWSATCLIA